MLQGHNSTCAGIIAIVELSKSFTVGYFYANCADAELGCDSSRYLSELLRCIPNRLASIAADAQADPKNTMFRNLVLKLKFNPTAVVNDDRYSIGRVIFTTVTHAKK
mmetsp:Transcript_23042/g.41533  ORF Transcript_23042/g.41533 Transcript_23042/m.41533 type:complete len:107 (-) Transcript_23042:1712-2032(-)